MLHYLEKIGIESNSNELYKIAILIAVEHITNYKKVIEHKDDKSLNEICHIGKHDFLNEEKFIIGNKKENILIEALKLHRELLKEKEDIYVLSKKLDKLLSIIESAK